MSSASWAVVAQGRNQPLARAPYILVWSVATGTAYDYFNFVNVGSTVIQGFRVTITQVRLTGTAKSQEIYFERCIAGAWNTATNTCSGLITQVGKASDGFFTLSNLNLAVNASLEIRARTVPNNQSTFETTLSTQINRTQIGSPQVINS